MAHWRLVAAAVVGAAVVGGISCSDGAITRPQPGEEPVADLQLGASLQGTVPATGTVRVLLEAPEGRAIRLALQGTGGSSADTVLAVVRTGASGIELARVSSDGAAPSPTRDATLVGAMAVATLLEVELSRAAGSGSLAFTLTAEALTTRPEAASDTLRLDVATVEAMDDAFDVDHFVLDVMANQRVVLFMAMAGATPSTQVLLRATSAVTAPLSSFQSAPNYPQYSRSLVLEPTASTRFTVAVSRLEPISGWSGGTYTLLPLLVPRTPELAAERLTLDVPVVEQVDEVGDVDEFRVAVLAGGGVRARVVPDAVPNQPLTLTVQLPGVAPTEVPISGTTILESQTPALQEGDAIIRVHAPTTGDRDGLRVGYELTLLRPATEPENVPSELTHGVTVTAESIDFPGDVDDFRISVPEGKYLALRTSASTSITVLGSDLGLGVPHLTELGAPGPDGFRSSIHPAPASERGALALRVRSLDGTTPSYALTAWIVDSTPEWVSPDLPLNTWVTGERLDAPGDLDVFRLPAQSKATQVLVGLEADSGSVGTVVYTVGDWQNAVGLEGYATVLFDRAVPADSVLPVRLHGRIFSPAAAPAPGGYRVIAVSIDSMPELVPTQLAIGDSINETLTPYDVDRFRVDAPPGTTFRVSYRGPPSGDLCVADDDPPLIVRSAAGETREIAWSGDQIVVEVLVHDFVEIVVTGRRDRPSCDIGMYSLSITSLP
ncbi:MAG: hypothetical protein KF709_09965 [Gemmatimonadaceae bacterium]|nr:hypothetical protein [Gemmatimonadaceae bacterium]